MSRVSVLAFVVSVGFAAPVLAQSGARFQWQANQTLRFHVEQTTTVREFADGQQTDTLTKMSLVKSWRVLEVDAGGVATIQLSLASLRLETRAPDGASSIFDSAKPDPMQPELNKEMSQYIDKPIATMRIDGKGNVVEVKESKFGPGSRYLSDLPFKMTLPEMGLQAGQTWERAYKTKLEPPHGAGETFDSLQKYTCHQTEKGMAVVTMTTTIQGQPESAADRIPLLPMQLEGTLYFDVNAGRYRGARLKLERTFENHRGDGSKYIFSTTFTEAAIDN
jgi:hypothetical protein